MGKQSKSRGARRMKNFLGKCGCNCGRCPAFKANARTSKDKKFCRDGWNKYLGTNMTKFAWILCNGCQASDPWKSGNLLPDRTCNIRPCVIKMGIKTCAQCSAFPCEDLKQRIPGRNFRKKVESRLGKPIPQKDYVNFIEPYEGVGHLEDIRVSLRKKDIIKLPRIPPLRIKIESFPDKLPFSKKKILAFKAIHKLLTNILTGRAKRFARQDLIKKRKNVFLSLLWNFGRYGKLVKKGSTQLVIDSKTVKSVPDFNNIVRKRDNSLHTTAAQCFMIFRDYGIRAEHKSVKKDWLMKLFFGKRAGGAEALKALKHYTQALVKKYGEPVYAGSSRLKGKASTLFSKADMRVLCKR